MIRPHLDKRRPHLWLGVLALGLLACDPPASADDPSPAAPPGDGNDADADADAHEAKVEAQLADPVPDAETGDESRPLSVDLDRSKVGFFVAKATAGHEAKFERFSATLTMHDQQPKELTLDLDVASLRTDQAALTKHLKSEDFFHVDAHPKASFTSSSMVARPSPNEEATHDVEGQLTIKGVTKTIEFPAVVTTSEQQVRGTATLDIEAKNFGIDYPGMAEELVDDTVELEVTLVFERP